MVCSLLAAALPAHAEFPPLPDEAAVEEARPYPAATNRWQGNYPAMDQAVSENPWGASGPIVREQPGNQFGTPAAQFPDMEYSPYTEGRKKMRSRQQGSGMPPPAYPGYRAPYYPPAGVAPYGPYPGTYPGAWPGGGYGGPWPGYGPGYDGPWNHGGGGFPFSPFNW